MNKTININLGGFPFIIDENAYERLEKYTRSLKQHFSNSEGYHEIISDIEVRIGELIQEKIGNKTIVMDEDVIYAISIMGTAKDFEIDSENPQAQTNSNNFSNKYSPGKRLFRNSRDKILGGVCGGLSTYLGIKNSIWVRILFIALLFTFGASFFIYILLWIFLPEAKTPSDFLAMEGKNASVTNIAEFVESGIDKISDKINGEFNNIGNNKNYFSSGRFANNVESFIHTIFRIIKPIFLIIAGIFVICIGAGWIGLIIAFFFTLPFIKFFSSNNEFISFFSTLNGFAILAIPLFFIILLVIKLIFKTKINNRFNKSMGLFWLLNIVSLGILTGFTAQEFKYENTQEIKENLSSLNNNIIHINYEENNKKSVQFDKFFVNMDDDLEINYNINFNILPAEGSEMYLIQKISSRGRSAKEAAKNATCIQYKVNIKNDSILSIPNYIQVNKSCKYRFQNAILDFYIPIGQKITFDDEDLNWIKDKVSYDSKSFPNGFVFKVGMKYEMTKNGLICLGCTEDDLYENLEIEEANSLDLSQLPDDYILHTNTITKLQPKNNVYFIHFDKIMSGTSRTVYFDDIQLNIVKSKNNDWNSAIKLDFYTNNPHKDSIEYQKFYEIQTIGNELFFANKGYIPSKLKPVNAKVLIKLEMPVGTSLKLENQREFFNEIFLDNKMQAFDELPFNSGQFLKMTDKGIIPTDNLE